MVEQKIPHLSSQVSIHNFHSVTSTRKNPIVFCTWPIPNAGYRGIHVLEIWQEIRRQSLFDSNGEKRESPLPVAYFSSDSSSHSLYAGSAMMTPSTHHVQTGIKYLGLPIEDQAHYAPYYWEYPSIYVPDPEHLLRLFLRSLKYETHDLIFFKSKNDILLATSQHFLELRKIKNVNISLQDLIIIKYCDQNTQAADKIFDERHCQYLLDYVPHSQATVLYLKAVCFLMKPYRMASLSPEEVVKFSSAGIYIFRLWRKYLELMKMKLNSLPGAHNAREKRGNFVTSQCYRSAELLHSASICHLLALHRHCPQKLSTWASPIQAGTDTTERIISEIQGKSCQLQSLDSQPTYSDILQKISIVQQNQQVEDRIFEEGGKRRCSNRRRKNMEIQQQERLEQVTAEIPVCFEDFCQQLIQQHLLGIELAQNCIEELLPRRFKEVLQAAQAWDCPYKFPKPTGFELYVIKSCP